VTVRIVTYNIRKGGRPRHKLISEVLAELDADVVLLEEAVDLGVVAMVSRAIGAHVALAAPGRSVAVLSRVDGLEAEWGRGVRGPRYAEVRLPGLGIRILALHLTAGLSGRGERRRARELDHVLAAARRIEPQDDAGARDAVGPGDVVEPGDDVVLAGDFNAVAPGEVPAVAQLPRWIRLLLRIDGGISTHVMERALAAGFTDAYRTLHPETSGATIPAMSPVLRLDYFLLGAGTVSRLVRCELPAVDPVLLAAASDHLPLVLDLDVRPAADPQRAAKPSP
jgi:endonuclease/exonuclease/phosphatase family metal-dependent hydrolase